VTLFQGTLKTIASGHKWGNTLPIKKNSFLPIFRNFYFSNKGIYSRIFRFQKSVLPFGKFLLQKKDWFKFHQFNFSFFYKLPCQNLNKIINLKRKKLHLEMLKIIIVSDF
jgi:hypothetical protein